jgi:tRNA(Ile)-lysidine synthase
MIHITNKLPRNVGVAVSGGIDSVVALDFLSRNHNVTVFHVDHSEGNSVESYDFVKDLSAKYNCPFVSYKITKEQTKGCSREEFWRNERYAFFHSYAAPIVTAHTLDDSVETWIWSSLHGKSRVIPYNNRNVIRPFRTTKKSDFKSWAAKKQLTWIEDESNKDMSLTRNYIRHQLMPHALAVNPGLHKVVLKKILKEQNGEEYCN